MVLGHDLTKELDSGGLSCAPLLYSLLPDGLSFFKITWTHLKEKFYFFIQSFLIELFVILFLQLKRTIIRSATFLQNFFLNWRGKRTES